MEDNKFIKRLTIRAICGFLLVVSFGCQSNEKANEPSTSTDPISTEPVTMCYEEELNRVQTFSAADIQKIDIICTRPAN